MSNQTGYLSGWLMEPTGSFSPTILPAWIFPARSSAFSWPRIWVETGRFQIRCCSTISKRRYQLLQLESQLRFWRISNRIGPGPDYLHHRDLIQRSRWYRNFLPPVRILLAVLEAVKSSDSRWDEAATLGCGAWSLIQVRFPPSLVIVS